MPRIRVITAPEKITHSASDELKTEFVDHPKVFLSGGITDCPDWQSELIRLIQNNVSYDLPDKPALGIYLLNPRRAVFQMGNVLYAKQQIQWEHEMLRRADIISFWFSRGSVNPIALFALGAHLLRNIVVGVDPDYPRRFDVFEQLALAVPDLIVQQRLEDMAEQILYKSTLFKYPNVI